MRAAHFGVLLLIGIGACRGQGDEKVGETTTTAGGTDEQRAAREGAQRSAPAAVPPAAPAAPTAAEPKGAAAKPSPETKAEMKPATKSVTKPATKAKKKSATARAPTAKEEPTSRTTITAVEIETVPPRRPSTEPLETPRAPATPPGGMPLQGSAAESPLGNHSTVLGDGTSGMYTDGKGTYGGRATWGTGGTAGTGATSRSREP